MLSTCPDSYSILFNPALFKRATYLPRLMVGTNIGKKASEVPYDITRFKTPQLVYLKQRLYKETIFSYFIIEALEVYK